jgi:abortive infection bacteriophage resistance protein
MEISQPVAEDLGMPFVVMRSWLVALNTIRNRCAHHARLWDWSMGTAVLTPQCRKYPEWHQITMPNNKIGIVLIICRYWLSRIFRTDEWSRRVGILLHQMDWLPLALMGLPENWGDHPVWLLKK